jgi:hypothetical protein
LGFVWVTAAWAARWVLWWRRALRVLLVGVVVLGREGDWDDWEMAECGRLVEVGVEVGEVAGVALFGTSVGCWGVGGGSLAVFLSWVGKE